MDFVGDLKVWIRENGVALVGSSNPRPVSPSQSHDTDQLITAPASNVRMFVYQSILKDVQIKLIV